MPNVETEGVQPGKRRQKRVVNYDSCKTTRCEYSPANILIKSLTGPNAKFIAHTGRDLNGGQPNKHDAHRRRVRHDHQSLCVVKIRQQSVNNKRGNQKNRGEVECVRVDI